MRRAHAPVAFVVVVLTGAVSRFTSAGEPSSPPGVATSTRAMGDVRTTTSTHRGPPPLEHPPELPVQLSVDGQLRLSEVDALFKRAQGRVRACYEIGLKRHPDLRGRILFDLEVDKRGTAERVVVRSSTLSDREVVACVREVLRGLKYPRPADGRSAVIHFPLTLMSAQ